jgi:CDP-diacylglycerol--serine O-phosphatidyltransferase
MPLPEPTRRYDDPSIHRRRMRKGLYILPSLFTSLNIAAGYYALSQVLLGSAADFSHFDNAAKAIGFAILADGLDGRIARLTNTTSEFGRELDSLADVIAFGVAPAVLAWVWGFRLLPVSMGPELRLRLVQIGAIATFLFLTAGASRLARFNIQKNPQPSNPGRPDRKYFVGMPIPAGAAVVAAVVHFSDGRPLVTWWEAAVWALFVAAAGFLMVSTWRFYSGKELDLRSRRPFRLIVLIGGLIALCWFFSGLVLFCLTLAYMLSGVVTRLSYIFHRRPAPPSGPPPYQEVSHVQ